VSGDVHVTDSGGWWHVFNQDFELLRKVNGQQIGPLPEFRVLLDDERAIISYRSVALAAGGTIALVDREGRIVRAFGSSQGALSGTTASRALAYDGGATFWSVQTYSGGSQYRVEKWDTAGELLAVLERRAEWLPAVASVEVPMPVTVRQEGRRRAIMKPAVRFNLHIDPTGILVVRVTPDQEPTRIECIDPTSGLLIASAIADQTAVPTGFFPRTRLFYRHVSDSNGDQGFRIGTYEIIPAGR
jgi:hypothetical protein